MNKFLSFKFKPYPLFTLLISLTLIIYGLIMARDINTTYLMAGFFIFFILFGYWKEALKGVPFLVFFGGLFTLITYYISYDYQSTLAMANRFLTLFIALIPSVGTDALRMKRALEQIKTPRFITLGMLIAMNFVPTLKMEIKKIRQAMKTRGTICVFNPKIIYRAYLIPFVLRLTNISDILSTSIETRGFSIDSNIYTIYNEEKVVISDIIFFLVSIAGIIVAGVLWVQ